MSGQKLEQRKQLVSATNDRTIVQQWHNAHEHSDNIIEKLTYSAKQRLNEHNHTTVDVSASSIERQAANIRMHLHDQLIMQHLRSMSWLQKEPYKAKLSAANIQSSTVVNTATNSNAKTRIFLFHITHRINNLRRTSDTEHKPGNIFLAYQQI